MEALRIIDRRQECDDELHRARGVWPGGITIHMFGVPGVHDAAGIARFYRQHPQWTDGQMPYTYAVLGGGFVEQALDIFELGPHARRWSSPTIGVVAIGNFNEDTPRPEQWNATVDICAELSVIHRLDPRSKEHLAGHTERPRATHNPGKNCPGKFWDMHRFRAEVDSLVRNAAIQRLEHARVVT